MMVQAAPWEEASCGPPVSVAWVGCSKGLEGGEAMGAGTVGDAGEGGGCEGMGGASTCEVKSRSISTWREELKKCGKLSLISTLKN
jgi:hypothetical protein